MKVDIFNTNKKYNVIYADPPWNYPLTGSTTNARGLAKQHYDIMTLESICNLPIKDLTMDNTILFMWATFPMINEALTVIKEWGFEYKTAAFVWVKKNRKSESLFWGMGAYTRANAEICLLAISKKTKAKQLVKRHDIHQIIMSPIAEHSKKPDIVREKIVQLLGDMPRIELFARQSFPGWDCWGLEAPND